MILPKAIAASEEQEHTEIDYKQKIIAVKDAIAILQNDAASVEDKNSLLRVVIKDIIYHRNTPIRDKWHQIPFTLDIELL